MMMWCSSLQSFYAQLLMSDFMALSQCAPVNHPFRVEINMKVLVDCGVDTGVMLSLICTNSTMNISPFIFNMYTLDNGEEALFLQGAV